MKVSYSCTDNLQTIIKKHNRKILETSKTPSTENKCNCRKKNDCPLKNNCLTSSVVYNANVTTENDTTGKNYIGLTEGTFKQRYTQQSFQMIANGERKFLPLSLFSQLSQDLLCSLKKIVLCQKSVVFAYERSDSLSPKLK